MQLFDIHRVAYLFRYLNNKCLPVEASLLFRPSFPSVPPFPPEMYPPHKRAGLELWLSVLARDRDFKDFNMKNANRIKQEEEEEEEKQIP